MNFKEDIILEDEVALLRPLQATDFDNLLEYSVNEPEIWQYSTRGADGPEKLKRYIETTIKQRELEKEYPFIVFDKRKGKYIGSTRFYDINTENKSLLLGYTWYGKAYQGTGINKHCKYLLLQYAFEKLGMERVEFRANNNNKKSINAMQSIGCKVEGILRNYGTDTQGKRYDAIILSIIKSEWETEVKKALHLKLAATDSQVI